MKRLANICIILLCFITTSAYANRIVALVNNQPITDYNLNIEYNIIKILNGLDESKINVQDIRNQVLNNIITKILVKDQIGEKDSKPSLTEESVKARLKHFEEAKGLPTGTLSSRLRQYGITNYELQRFFSDADMMENVYRQVSNSGKDVSKSQIKTTISQLNARDFEYKLKVFSTNDKNEASYNNLDILRSKVKCNNYKNKLGKDIKVSELSTYFSQLHPMLQTAVVDLDEGESSIIYQTEQNYNFVLVCEKDVVDIKPEQVDYLKNMLGQKRMNKNLARFIKTLRSKANIKIFN